MDCEDLKQRSRPKHQFGRDRSGYFLDVMNKQANRGDNADDGNDSRNRTLEHGPFSP